MSLYADEDRHRARSRSGDRRSRNDPPPVERSSYADIREPSYVYPEDDLDDRYAPRRDDPSTSQRGGLPYPSEGGIHYMLPGDRALYSYDSQQPIYRTASPSADAPYRSSRDQLDDKTPGAFPEDDDATPHIRTAEPRESKRERKEKKEKKGKDRDDDEDDRRRVRYAEPRYEDRELDDDKLKYLPQKYNSRSGGKEGKSRGTYDDEDQDDKLKYLPSKYSSTYEDPGAKSRDRYDSREPEDDKLSFLPKKYSSRYAPDDAKYSDRERDSKADRRRRKKEREEEDLAYGKPPGPSRSSRQDEPPQTYGSYLSESQFEDRRSSRYSDDPRRRPISPSVEEDPGSRRSKRDSYRDDPRDSRPDVLTVEPGDGRRDRSRDRRGDKSPGPSGLTVEPADRERDRSRDRRSSKRDKSPQPPTARMSSLTVDTGRSSNMSLAAAPASPLLESYHGTYQDCSPMPSPLLLASGNPSDDPRALEALSPIASDNEADGKRRSRRARFHDPEDIATRLAKALRGDGPPDKEPLVEILPSLTHEQVMELRAQYKTIVKTGSQRKGVNIAKHIRARLKDENPNLMKACYSVALGMWESEAYWANFWYQGDKTRRELLIESIMGRTNDEIRRIKDAFTDKKYDNSLTKCMKTELKEDKFKKAVLMVLDERRMDEYDPYGRRLPIDYKLVDQDVDGLRRAVKSEKGGETLMISIVVQRSDSHLRAVLKEYEAAFRANFARDALKKSGNLVVRSRQPPSSSSLLTSPLPRVNYSLTSSTASSTGPSATPSSSTTP